MIAQLFPFNILTFNSRATQNINEIGVSSIIEFDHLAEQDPSEPVILGQEVISELLLSQTFTPHSHHVTSIINFTQFAQGNNPLEQSVTSYLSFGNRVAFAERIDVYQNLFLQQFVNRPQHSEINFESEVEVHHCRFTSDLLEFVDEALVQFIDVEELEQELVFVGDVRVLKDGDSSCLFSAIDIPNLTKRDHIVLSDGVTSFTIRNPEFGDKDSNQHLRIQRKSLGGDLIVHREDEWPKVEVLSYTFRLLKQEDANTIRQFFRNNLGEEITLEDHYSRTWTGVIITPDSEIVQQKSFEWEISFDFEGVLS